MHMTSNHNDRAKELFDENANELGSITLADDILFMPTLSDGGCISQCLSTLSDIELQQANCFLTNRDRSLFIQRRAFRRYCGAMASDSPGDLSLIAFEESDNGRPYLPKRPDLWFSFSSCGSGLIGAWSSTHAIGVDIEDRTAGVEAAEIAHMFFTRSEALAVEAHGSANTRAFTQLWCLKEAALKSIGEGLPFGLDSFEFELNGKFSIVAAPAEHGGPKQFNAQLFEQNKICAALVARMPRS